MINSPQSHSPDSQILDNPFNLDNSKGYMRWRADKVAAYPLDTEQLIVKIKNPHSLDAEELKQVKRLCAQYNMAIYQLEVDSDDKSLVHDLGKQFGLTHLDNNLRADEDSVTSLEVRAQQGNQYIPYTNRPLSWHTDGYYNELNRQIRSVILHCVRPAAEGGINALLDHEMLYMQLRDENPAWIKALMHPEAMTIPANVEDGAELRCARTGPVFSVDVDSGCLHMRYSARKRNIVWRDDKETLEAARRISGLLDESPMVFRYKLQAGQGIISNNVLHNRTGFSDAAEQPRLMYRARYIDRIVDTGFSALPAQ